jgi:deazaflavin-dependent oxidoreductase (nitroreductase family)
MLEHTGRRSGLPRYVVLEVVERQPPGCFLVVCGFGDRAQWFLNIRANPHIRLYRQSREPVAATARILPRNEASAVLGRYALRHPRTWEAMRSVLSATLGAAECEVVTRLPVVALEVER